MFLSPSPLHNPMEIAVCLHSLGYFACCQDYGTHSIMFGGFSPPSFFLTGPYSPDVDETGDASQTGAFFVWGFAGLFWAPMGFVVFMGMEVVCLSLCVVAQDGVISRCPFLVDLVWSSVVHTQSECGPSVRI